MKNNKICFTCINSVARRCGKMLCLLNCRTVKNDSTCKNHKLQEGFNAKNMEYKEK